MNYNKYINLSVMCLLAVVTILAPRSLGGWEILEISEGWLYFLRLYFFTKYEIINAIIKFGIMPPYKKKVL
jgi:hypothetical protein